MGNDNKQVYIFRVGVDGNILGGIRLPHLRTVLPIGNVVGGPLGLYRGVECNNDPIQNSFILGCQISGDATIYNIVGGTLIPYASGQYAAFYDSYETYLNAVTDAVNYAVAEGWFLPEETDSIIALAAQKSLAGCRRG